MNRPQHTARQAPVRARGRRQEGAVMLVVMLLLMMATAAAAMSVQATQYELQAAGNERQALQTRYISETVAMTTVSWFDKVFDPVTGGGFTRFYDTCTSQAPPAMWRYGQPEVDTTTQSACRLSWLGMRMIDPQTATEVGPLSTPVSASQTVPEGQATPDYLGSLGPRQAYRPQLAFNPAQGPDFVTDIVCRPEIVEAGTVVAGSTTGTRTRRYYCVVTARASTVQPGIDANPAALDPLERGWALSGQTVQQNPFSTYHEMRMTLLTPEEVF